MSNQRKSVIARGYAGLVVILCTIALGTPVSASAHAGGAADPNHVWSYWDWAPSLLVPLIFTLYVYLRGLTRLWHRAGWGRGVSYARAAFFLGGLLTLFVALVSPVDAMADALLSVHMIQHLLLITVSAPLLVLGKPLVPLMWALPREWRHSIGRTWNRSDRVRDAWHALTLPTVVGALFSGVFLIWHVPPLYQLAIRNDAIHALEHACFLGSGLLFWWVVIQPTGHQQPVGPRIALLALAMLVGSVLGALMTFSQTTWYPIYGSFAADWGRSPLEDQQLAGLIMWIPAGAIYIAVGLGLLGAWFHQADHEDDNLVFPLMRNEVASEDGGAART